MKELMIGMVGLDTSHVTAFIQAFNDPTAPFFLPGAGKVLKAYPGGSDKFSKSRNRVAGFCEFARNHQVELVDSLEGLADMDAYLLESVDGDQHLEQFRILAEFGKPVFIDKPLACNYQDAKKIMEIAQQKQIPLLTASSIRFAAGVADLLPDNDKPEVFAVEAFGPMELPPDYRDYFWYGIHCAETIYRYLGCGCQSVRTIHSENFDTIIGTWTNGRQGIVCGNRVKANNFGARLTTSAGHFAGIQKPEIPYMPTLSRILSDFFHTKVACIDPAESLEVIGYLEAASRSLAENGREITLDEIRK